MTPEQIDHLLEEVVTLPSLPRNIDSLTELVNDPEAPLSEVARAIAVDPAFAIKTLRLANSAYYGRRQEITSVDLAVTLLGIRVIRNLVFTALVCETLRGADALLRHSVACGLAMQVLAEQAQCSVVQADEAFTYGLLHDIGKVIFETFLPEEGRKAAQLSQERQMPLHEAEKEVLGLDHAALGAMLAARWKLPQRLADSIAGHHAVEACEDPDVRRVAGLLAVADVICTCCGLQSGYSPGDDLTDAQWAASNMRKEDLLPALEDYFTALPTIKDLIGLAS